MNKKLDTYSKMGRIIFQMKDISVRMKPEVRAIVIRIFNTVEANQEDTSLRFKLRDDPRAASLTSAGAIVGTPNYLAPEQARGRDVDARADLYAAGAVLFELLTGRPPFVAPNPMAVVNAHLHDPPPPLHAFAPECTSAMGEVIRRALEKRPEDRYQTADQMREALLAAGEPSGPSTPRRPFTPEVTGELEIASRDDFRELEEQIKALKRSRVAAPVAVALLLLVTGLVAWRWGDVYGLLARFGAIRRRSRGRASATASGNDRAG